MIFLARLIHRFYGDVQGSIKRGTSLIVGGRRPQNAKTTFER